MEILQQERSHGLSGDVIIFYRLQPRMKKLIMKRYIHLIYDGIGNHDSPIVGFEFKAATPNGGDLLYRVHPMFNLITRFGEVKTREIIGSISKNWDRKSFKSL